VEQARLLAADLAAQDERGVELVAMFFEHRTVALVNLAQRIAHDARRVEEVLGAQEAGRFARVLRALVQQGHHRLRDREIAGRHEDHRPFVRVWNTAILRKVLI